MWDNPLALIAVIVFAVLAAYVIWTLEQLRRTLQRIDEMIINTEREMTPLLSNLRESSEHIRATIVQMQKGVNRAEGLLEAIGEVGDSIHDVNEFLRSGTRKYLHQGMALWSGFKVFRNYFEKFREAKGD